MYSYSTPDPDPATVEAIFAPALIEPNYSFSKQATFSSEFLDHCLSCGSYQKLAPDSVERATKDQNPDTLWCYLHSGRITLSRFHDIHKETTPIPTEECMTQHQLFKMAYLKYNAHRIAG